MKHTPQETPDLDQRKLEVRKDIVAGLRKGHEVEDGQQAKIEIDDVTTVTTMNLGIKVDGVWVTLYVTEVRGRLRLHFRTIGDIRSTHMLEPEKGFDIDKLVAKISASVAKQKAEDLECQEEHQANQAAQVIADRINADYAVVDDRVIVDDGKLFVAIEHACTEEQARAFMKLAESFWAATEDEDDEGYHNVFFEAP